MKKVLHLLLVGVFFALGSFVGFVSITCAGISVVSKKACFKVTDSIPSTDYGILLGTGCRSGKDSPYYESRLRATMDLYRAKKIDRVFISGENQYPDFYEVDSMASALIFAGVPKENIVIDTLGRDTETSLLHAKELSLLGDRFTIISQHFHNERALFYANHIGLRAIAFDADDTNITLWRIRNFIREIGARMKAIYIVNFK